jgi:hypothetical protein
LHCDEVVAKVDEARGDVVGFLDPGVQRPVYDAIVESEGQRHAGAIGGVGCYGACGISTSLLASIGENASSALRATGNMSMQGDASESELTGCAGGRGIFARHGVGGDDASRKGRA